MFLNREYENVPEHLKVDNVLPSVSEIPSFLSSIRHPQRSRAVSVGPQSAADAYETLAFREKRRRESISTLPRNIAAREPQKYGAESSGYFEGSNLLSQRRILQPSGSLPTPPSSSLNLHDYMTEDIATNNLPLTPDALTHEQFSNIRSISQDRRQNEKEDREMFSRLQKPRVRYDVEVVTKLIVYTGRPFLRLNFCCLQW